VQIWCIGTCSYWLITDFFGNAAKELFVVLGSSGFFLVNIKNDYGCLTVLLNISIL